MHRFKYEISWCLTYKELYPIIETENEFVCSAEKFRGPYDKQNLGLIF